MSRWQKYKFLKDGKRIVISRYGTNTPPLDEHMSINTFFKHDWKSVINRRESNKNVVKMWDEFLSLFKKRLLYVFWKKILKTENRDDYRRVYTRYMLRHKMRKSEKKRYRKLKKYFMTSGLIKEGEI